MAMAVLKLQGTVIHDQTLMRRLVGSTTRPRTDVDSNTILDECKIGTVTTKRTIERLNMSGIANDHCGAGVENRLGPSHHWHWLFRVASSDGDLVKERLPITLKW